MRSLRNPQSLVCYHNENCWVKAYLDIPRNSAKHSRRMARVVIENLSKTFLGAKGEKICAVRNLSLTIEDKEFLVLVGPSGCGKTTTLRMIAGLEDVSQGTISIDDRVINSVEP